MRISLDCAYLGCDWRWLDLSLGGHVALQGHVLHVVVVEDVEPGHLVRLGVGVLALPLGDVDVASLVRVQEEFGFGNDDVLARKIDLVDDCNIEDCELL